MPHHYASPPDGLPAQTYKMDPRAVFTQAYAFIPASVMRSIVTSYLPNWNKSKAWILARPLSGFAETFSQYIMKVEPGGGSDDPESDETAQCVLFITSGELQLKLNGEIHALSPGSYAYIPSGETWAISNSGSEDATFHWIRKRYQTAQGIAKPEAFVVHEADIQDIPMPDTNGVWATKRFVDPMDLRHDMHVNIVTFKKGGVIPFAETHVMEHGLYVLEGEAKYLLNQDWVDVGPGDFMWLRAFCPQACKQVGNAQFRYLLYKDVNRHASLDVFGKQNSD